ncbi:hypothetical protein MRB53_009098 [Persea americana]|uniref:Uncharacterized protein n=1 Tax=Persea americana TaxID=3435 RepID=A0ACC2LN39_PERAE|nr:hypothetical protein MRB53_009098 [Persea americana]
MSSRGSGLVVKCCLVAFAVASALFVSWPAISWSFRKGIKQGLVNLSISDCGKHDPDLNKEMEKQSVDLLTEELQLQETVAQEHTQHMNLTFIEARRLASQYQKEAEKCNAATEACEEARERAEASLIREEKKVTALWERRARHFGWQGE